MSPNSKEYYRLAIADLEKMLATDVVHGLSREQAAERLQKDGPNAFGKEEKISPLDRIVDELRSPLTFTLLVAGIVTTLLAEYVDATVIFLALVVNVLINLYQEGRASKAFAALKAGEAAFCTVIRGGEPKLIPVTEVVVGDVLLLQSGATVPADARIIDAHGAQLNESVLTGEWAPVVKHAEDVPHLLPLTEQKNMLFMGTLVASGVIKAVVVLTGEHTAFGGIAASLRTVKAAPTPMQKNIAAIARMLTVIIIVALVIVFLLGIYRGVSLTETLLIAIAIAVAAIPEGMPAAVSVMLAMSMQRILGKGGLVRSLLAAETLGSATVIITDKTGTLTEGQMTLERVVCYHALTSSEAGFKEKRLHEEHGDEHDALSFAYLSSNVIIENEHDQFRHPEFHGRPVEVAIARAAHLSGVDMRELERDYQRIDASPFISSLRMSLALTGIRGMKHNRLIGLGAAEEMLARARAYYADGKAHPMHEDERKKFEEALRDATREGVRVVAVGYVDSQLEKLPTIPEEIEELFSGEGTFVLCGLLYLADPLRSDVRAAITTARNAGIRVIMATGDNPETARAIAIGAGIVAHPQAPVLLGAEFDDMTDTQLLEQLRTVNVCARMLPTHKQRMAQLLTESGEVVAMTGDGVNDAPALRTAAIGIALGSGTDVAKEASGLVLTNNSFGIIVSAIEEGRRAVDNIRKNVAYLISTSFSEIMLVVMALALALPIPLLPTQILWTNMLTEGLMNFAFAFEQSEKGIMTRSPRVHGASSMLSRRFMVFIITIGVVTGIILIGLYAILHAQQVSESASRTVLFVALTLLATFVSFSLRDLHTPLWHIKPWTNPYLLVALVITLLGLAVALFVPHVARLLQLDPAGFNGYFGHVAVALALMFVGVESAKYFILRKS
ncbi:MAG TPA: cation-transporting P-type ATPase [Candidatus Paceibacterota bacterium]|nr:cation-transporting P-type ATPase [Candidatus Paceibacterota bacterium]